MNIKKSSKRGLPAFAIACWVIAAVVFVQLLVGGVALALRVEAAREVRVEEKIVTRIVEVGSATGEPASKPAAPAEELADPVVALPPPPDLRPAARRPAAEPLQAPPIADPVVERLVHEAREARVAEDMGRAIIKLKEAQARAPEDAPDDPSVLYELGLVYETMAAFDASLADHAAEAFQGVYDLGTTGAGALYPLAARKLRDGISLPRDMLGNLGLGRVRIFRDEAYAGGERVVLTVPVHAVPGQEPEADDFFVQVNFFNENAQGDPVPAGPESETDFEWISGGIDWMGGEETLRVTYVLPRGSRSDTHLFGRLKYYGQNVQLIYKNKLIDNQAWPRHLAAEGADAGGSEPMDPLFLDHEFDPGGPLLPPPPIEGEIPSIDLPPFPED